MSAPHFGYRIVEPKVLGETKRKVRLRSKIVLYRMRTSAHERSGISPGLGNESGGNDKTCDFSKQFHLMTSETKDMRSGWKEAA
jgi:hypothetical protein